MMTKVSLPTLAVACLALTASFSAPKATRAQTAPAAGVPQRTGSGRLFDSVADAFKTISATADQQTKFDALTVTWEFDITAARAEADQREMGRRVTAAIDTYRTSTEALLTPDQLTKFRQAWFARPAMRNLNIQLVFTEDEKRKVEPILDDYASKADGLKGAELRSLVDDTRAKIRAVLTVDQQTKLDALHGLTGGPRAPAAPPSTTLPAAPPTP